MSAHYYSKNHVFTNRKRGGDITLSAGPDEKLVIDGNFAISNIKYISTKEDFPEAISGIITLENNTTYVILKTVDLTGDRIVCGTNNSLQGTFTEQSILKSTGLGTDYLITSTSSFNIHDLQVQNVNYVLNLDSSTSEQAVYFRAFNVTGAATHIGTIKDYDLVMMSDCYFNGYGLSFSGTISTIGLQNCLFISVDGTAITSTATITTRIKIMDSSFYTTSPSVSLNVSGTISSQAYFLSNNVFQGTGTYLAGYTSTDNQSYFNHNTGITNSKSYGNWYYSTSVGTTLAAANTWYKVAGVSTISSASKFSKPSNGRLKYDGAISTLFLVNINLSLGNTLNINDVYQIGISVNGNAPTIDTIVSFKCDPSVTYENISKTCFVSLVTNDTVEIQVMNTTAAGFTQALYGSLSIIST